MQELTKTHVICLADLPADVIKMAKDIKPITEVKQNGNDFVITSKTPGKTVTNSFTIGKEAEITTMDGKKLKVSFSCFLIARFNMFSMSYQCLVNYFLLLVMRRQVYSVSLTPLFLPVMMICMFWSVCNVYCLLLSFPVHRQYGGWQNGLQDRQVLPHPGAQRRRDD